MELYIYIIEDREECYRGYRDKGYIYTCTCLHSQAQDGASTMTAMQKKERKKGMKPVPYHHAIKLNLPRKDQSISDAENRYHESSKHAHKPTNQGQPCAI